MQFFAQAAFFEARHDEDWSSGPRNDQPKQSLAKAPTNAREVVKRSARSKEERVVFCGLRRRAVGCERRFGHEPFWVFHAGAGFLGGDGGDAGREALSGGKSRRAGRTR